MRNQNTIAEPTVTGYTNRSELGAQMLISSVAGVTMPTTDPWVHDTACAGLDFDGIRAAVGDDTGDFMPQSKGSSRPLARSRCLLAPSSKNPSSR